MCPSHIIQLLSFDHNITVAEALSKGWQGLKFHRTLYVETLDLWNNLRMRCEEVEMGIGKDQVEWTLTADKKIYVTFLYRKLVENDCNLPQKFLWKVIPAKIKVFLWLLARKSILTKDNLLKRGWKGSKQCFFVDRMRAQIIYFFSMLCGSLDMESAEMCFQLKLCA